ncbi:MAG: hotdog fold thioesterase, partial [Proteobacteria bacterium]|nr:hotdog fold thioesterase [Pseudomonadota bacterium]
DKRTMQPLGILHGGASVVLAETLGSTASYMTLEDSEYSVGLEIKANHLKSVVNGRVKGVVKPVHLGKTTQVWDISIENEKNELICVSRLTMLVLKTVTDQKGNL